MSCAPPHADMKKILDIILYYISTKRFFLVINCQGFQTARCFRGIFNSSMGPRLGTRYSRPRGEKTFLCSRASASSSFLFALDHARSWKRRRARDGKPKN